MVAEIKSTYQTKSLSQIWASWCSNSYCSRAVGCTQSTPVKQAVSANAEPIASEVIQNHRTFTPEVSLAGISSAKSASGGIHFSLWSTEVAQLSLLSPSRSRSIGA